MGEPMTHVDIIPHGSRVGIGPDGSIDGIVIDTSIRAGVVQYRVAWWAGRERKTEWLEDCEIVSEPPTTERIGFRENGRNRIPAAGTTP